MADLIKKIKIKKQDGTFTDYIPIGAEAQNVDTNDGDSVQSKLNKKPYYYNSITDMKADLKLKTGDMAVTLGYYEPNDGGAGEYKIISGNYVDDGGSYHELNNNLFAELVIKTEGLNFAQFGAYTNNTNPNITTNRIQQAINYCQEHSIHITDSGKSIYQINDTLSITKKLSMDLNYAIIRATTENSILLFDETLDNDEQYSGNSHHGKIARIIIDCNNVSLKGIEVIRAPRRVFENLRVTNVPGTENNIGYAYYFSSTGPGAQLKLINCYADNKDINNYATVIYNAKSDIVVEGLDYVGFSRGIYHAGGNAYYNNCHGFITSPWAVSYPNSFFAWIENSTSRIVFNNPYPDTQKYGFYINGGKPRVKINGMSNFHNVNVAKKECIDTYGQAYLLYVEGLRSERYVSFVNSVFTSPKFSDGTRSVIFTNLEKPGFFIDSTMWLPPETDMLNYKNSLGKASIIQMQGSGQKFYRVDREDHGMAKGMLYKHGDNVITDLEVYFNPFKQGLLPRIKNIATQFGRSDNFNFSTSVEQQFIGTYGHETENGITNDGFVIFIITPIEENSSEEINQSRFYIVPTASDYVNRSGICDTTTDQEYIIDIKGTYIGDFMA